MPGTYEPIATQTLGSATASVTFSSIPSTYTDLVGVIFGLSTRTASQDMPTIRFNSDSGSNYSTTNVDGDATGITSVRWANETSIFLGFINDSNVTANPNLVFGNSIFNIMNYKNTTTNKTVLSRYNHTVPNDNYNRTGADVGLWRNTAAITSVTIGLYSATWAAGSTFTLYGIKAA